MSDGCALTGDTDTLLNAQLQLNLDRVPGQICSPFFYLITINCPVDIE